LGLGLLAQAATANRTVLPLNGSWQIARGPMDQPPAKFDHAVPVPGLADMAQPAFEGVGEKSDQPDRRAFWYRRTFSIAGPIPAVATLKIHKAAFGTRVYLNGQLIGDHVGCFTPGLFEVGRLLKGDGKTNELVIRVGAWRDAVGPNSPDGFDFEKIRYIPGIYDDVELILTGTPHVVRVQAVPDLEHQQVRIVATIGAAKQSGPIRVLGQVREARGGKAVGEAESQSVSLAAGAEQSVEFRIPIAGCRLWSPDDPFLYELTVRTPADTLSTRFGMRSFRLDPKTGHAVLNGREYFLRGTNVCIFRFMEDPVRGDRPWREQWVRRLHRTFKDMHWDAIRYCIGFPPEAWYRIADEEGLLIQDEFPIWYGPKAWPAGLTAEGIIPQYTEWMQEHWNHPCVVIWDAQNETVSQQTGKARQAVRKLDLSNRPWDNGYGEAGAPGDVFEAHPYLSNHGFQLAEFARMSGVVGQPDTPRGNARLNADNNPVIINEYAWLWLNRDGTATTLTKPIYDRVLPNSTERQRREYYARMLAAKTEFWRSHRKMAGVLEFCGLGYSRLVGQTSDHFTDIEKLTIDPDIRRYVRDAFAPVGLMIDFWSEDVPAGQLQTVPVAIINDLASDWQGPVTLRLLAGEKKCFEQTQTLRVAAQGRQVATFRVAVPSAPGRYLLEAELAGAGGEPVRSVRDVHIWTEAERKAARGLAYGRPVKASSSIRKSGATGPEAVVDGDPATRWSSEFSDPQWIAVDLGEPKQISRVELTWEGAYATAYAIQVSLDGEHWDDVYKTQAGKGRYEVLNFQPVTARWVRMHGTARGTPFGYSLWEMRVFP
jgi:uncharacterized protein CbrC (UPF0167 family)